MNIKNRAASQVLLINAEYSINLSDGGNEDSDNAPLGLVCIGTVIKKKGYNPVIIDCCLQKTWREDLRKMLGKGVLAVGISAMAIQTKSAVEISRLVREINTNIPIVYGGAHATCFPEETCRSKLVNYVVRGEGEFTFLELLDYLKYKSASNLKKDDPKKLAKIKGLTYKINGKVRSNENREYADFKKLSMPDWKLLDPEIIAKIRYAPVHSARGCSHRCTFCINRIYKNYWRSKTAEQVINELETSMKIFNTHKVNFCDENFFQNPERAKEIMREIVRRKLKITWNSNIRANYFTNGVIDKEALELLKKTGCEYVATGVESGSQRILDKIQKDIKVNDIIRECEILTEYGILPKLSFMIGLPGETKEDMFETINIINKVMKINPDIELLGPQKFRPYPGGDLYNEAVASGWKSPGSLEEWAHIMDENWNYLPASSFPWIADPDFVESIEAYASFGARSIKNSLNTSVKVNKFLLIGFIMVAKIRWKLKFFSFPVEYRLAQKVMKMKSKK